MFIAGFFCAQTAFAASARAAGFLTIPISARAASLAEAFTAVAEDVHVLQHNPAGLAFLEERQAALSHAELSQGVRLENVSAVHPVTASGRLGASVTFLYITDLIRTVADPAQADGFRETGNFSATDMAVSIAWGEKWNEQWSLGISLKLIRQTLDTQSAMSGALDAGLFFHLPYGLDGGIAMTNLGTKPKFISTGASLPTTLSGGLSRRWLKNRFLTSLDISSEVSDLPTLRAGLEYRFLPFFPVRLGYELRTQPNKLGIPSGLRGGMGLKHRKMEIDYALLANGSVGFSHRVTFSGRF